MLSLLKTKKKRKPKTPFILENLTAVMTLSDRLRQAGIRECEPDCSSNNSKNRKNVYERKKKLQNRSADLYSLNFKNSYQNEPCRGKTLPKNYKGFSRTFRRRIRGSAKKTLSASLDFIKDCQKYKKKVRTPKSHSILKSQQKSASASTDHNEPFDVKDERQQLQGSRTDNRVLNNNNNNKRVDSVDLNFSEGNKTENSLKKDSFLHENAEYESEKEAILSIEIKNQSKKKLPEEYDKYAEPIIDELPSGDVARIDKRYLQSLLSITNPQESKNQENKKEEDTKKSEEATNEKKKKKKSSKVFPEKNTRNQEAEDKGAEMQIDSKSNSMLLCRDLVPVRIVRDSTKSEVQILVPKEKNFSKQRNSEMKSEKNVAHNKHENDTRKKRKNRNKSLKNKNEEFSSETSPNEVSKVADIKELWRRETREKSENSLSSNSSSTVPENEGDPERKNMGLDSYKVLQKFVAEEVRKISNKSEKKDNVEKTKKKESHSKTQSKELKPLQESGKGENICKTINTPPSEISNEVSDLTNTKMAALKKKIIQTENQQCYTNYEGEKRSVELINLIKGEDNIKNQRGNIKIITEKEGKIGKTASQIVQKWSILNRLEQAFVALGTPHFQNKNAKDSKAFKNENSNSNETFNVDNDGIEKIQESTQKVNKIPPKSKEVAGKKYSGDHTNASGNSIKTMTQSSQNKKPENDKKRNLLKENHQGNKTKRDLKNDSSQNSSLPLKASKGKENNTKQKKSKFSNERKHETFPEKLTVKTLVNLKLSDNEFRSSIKKTGPQNSKYPGKDRSSAESKYRCKNIPSTNLGQSNSCGAALERKRTFDVIPNRINSTTLKSKSCVENDGNFESDSSKKHFSQTNEEIKRNLSSVLKSQCKSRENGSENKRKSKISKNLVKTPNKEKPKNSREKECVRGPRDVTVKTSQGKNSLEKNYERREPMEELPQQILAKKEMNSNERATKERSILSMRGNQQNTEELTKKMMKIEEKPMSDFCPNMKSSTGNLLIKRAQKDLDDLLQKSAQLEEKDSFIISEVSTSDCKLSDTDSNEKHNEVEVYKKENTWNYSKNLTPLFGFNNCFVIPEQNAGIEIELKPPRYKPLWEQDIHHYRAIVKDIMSQYKRLNGFLKQSDHLENFSNDSISFGLPKDFTSKESDNVSANSLKTDLNKYRKKIISEYQALPIFEYKSKIQEMKEENSREAKKRNLLVVKDIKAEMDLDVKDFQPNIQKVLDSQLYVDKESLVKRNLPKVKFKEKKSSLQEIVLGKNEKMVTQEECPRSSSTPKTFLLLPSSSFYSESTQKLKTIESIQENLTSTITSTSYMGETESEIL